MSTTGPRSGRPPDALPELRLERGRNAVIERLMRAEDGGTPALATSARLLDDGERLIVAFDCVDPEPWATHRERDAPLWEEEVVELFIAPGTPDPLDGSAPRRYAEFEVNPLGALFDALVDSPHGDRREMKVERSWSCAGLSWSAAVADDGASWSARLEIPWRSLVEGEPPAIWRANLYRVDRPENGRAEFSAWSPTYVEPADFHRPARFGILRRVV